MTEKLAVTITLDKNLKEKAEAVLSKAGISLDDAVAALLRRVAQGGELPFELSLDRGEAAPENATALAKAATSILSSLAK